MIIDTRNHICSWILRELVQNTVVSDLFLPVRAWAYSHFYLLEKLVGLQIRQLKKHFPDYFRLNQRQNVKLLTDFSPLATISSKSEASWVSATFAVEVLLL